MTQIRSDVTAADINGCKSVCFMSMCWDSIRASGRRLFSLKLLTSLFKAERPNRGLMQTPFKCKSTAESCRAAELQNSQTSGSETDWKRFGSWEEKLPNWFYLEKCVPDTAFILLLHSVYTFGTFKCVRAESALRKPNLNLNLILYQPLNEFSSDQSNFIALLSEKRRRALTSQRDKRTWNIRKQPVVWCYDPAGSIIQERWRKSNKIRN